MKIEELFSVQGKVALVTGGSRGIGEMIAAGILTTGVQVYISSRKKDQCDATAKRLSETYGAECISIPANLSELSGIESLVAALSEREDHLDILVNNAGVAWGAPLEEFPEVGWDKVFDTNVKGVFFLTQKLLPLLEANATKEDPARIINIGSVYGIQGGNPALYPGMDWDIAPYFVSKHAVHGIAHYLAPWLAKSGVTINTLHPGGFAGSEMNEKAMSERASGLSEMEKAFQAAVPMGRIGGPDDISAAAVFMASPGSKYMTGQEVVVDGGWSAW